MNISIFSNFIVILLHALLLFGFVYLAIKLPYLSFLALISANIVTAYIANLFSFKMFFLFIVLSLVLLLLKFGASLALLLAVMLFFPNFVMKFINSIIVLSISALRRISIVVIFSMCLALGIWFILPIVNSDGYKIWNIGEQIKFQTYKALKHINKVYAQQMKNRSHDFGEADVEFFIHNFKEIVEYFSYLIPTTYLFVWYFFSTLITYSMLSYYLSAYKSVSTHFELPKLAEWKYDGYLIWLFILGWYLYNFYDVFGITSSVANFFQVAGANLLAISKILYFIAGVSIIYYWCEKYNITIVNRIGLSILAIILNNLVIWLGILDIWADFRAKTTNSTKNSYFSSNDENEIF